MGIRWRRRVAETYMRGFDIEWKSTHSSDNNNPEMMVECVVYDGSLNMCRGLIPRGYWQEFNDKIYFDPAIISGAGGRSYIWIAYNYDNGACSITSSEGLKLEGLKYSIAIYICINRVTGDPFCF